jgi:hypothetical protein
MPFLGLGEAAGESDSRFWIRIGGWSSLGPWRRVYTAFHVTVTLWGSITGSGLDGLPGWDHR